MKNLKNISVISVLFSMLFLSGCTDYLTAPEPGVTKATDYF